MSEFGQAAKEFAKRMTYTEYEAKEQSIKKAKMAGDIIDENLEEPRLDELCHFLELDTSGLDNPATLFSPQDVALAAWSNWGAGSWEKAHPKSSLEGSEFIVLNDYFHEIIKAE